MPPRPSLDLLDYVHELNRLFLAFLRSAARERRDCLGLPSRAERAVWKRRLDALRPLLAPGVTDEQIQEVCQRQAIFAEEVLAAFLKLLGITDFYAHLSYDYLDESGPEELTAYQIRFVHHLHFTTAHPATIGGVPGAER